MARYMTPPRRPPPEPDPNARPLRTTRGEHPDLTESGQLRDDLHLAPQHRDFVRRWRGDPAWRDHFMRRVAASQGQEQRGVQEWVQGREYGTDPFLGYLEYVADLQAAREAWGANKEITPAQVRAMDSATFDRFFDRSGQMSDEARAQGFSYRPGDDDVLLHGAMDRFTALELAQSARRRQGEQP